MADEKAGGEPKQAASADPWRDAADRLRTTGRTFVVMLGSVAATVAAGLGLTQLGSVVPGTTRFAVAVGGVALAAVGIIVLLSVSVGLASASTVSLSELKTRKGSFGKARDIVGSPANGLLAGHASLDEFVAATQAALEAEREAVAAFAEDPSSENLAAQRNRRAVADWHAVRLRRLTSAASYLRLRARFEQASIAMAAAAVVAAGGIIAYAWAVTGAPGDVVVVTPHAQVTVAAPDDEPARARFHALLECTADAVDGLVLTEDEATVITLPAPDEGCRSITVPIRLDVDGRVVADPDHGADDTDADDGS